MGKCRILLSLPTTRVLCTLALLIGFLFELETFSHEFMGRTRAVLSAGAGCFYSSFKWSVSKDVYLVIVA